MGWVNPSRAPRLLNNHICDIYREPSKIQLKNWKEQTSLRWENK